MRIPAALILVVAVAVGCAVTSEPAVVEGTLVDALGQPAPNVTVVLDAFDNRGKAPGEGFEPFEVETTTGPDGRFCVPVRAVRSAPTVGRGQCISGQLRDHGRRSAAKAHLVVELLTRDGSHRLAAGGDAGPACVDWTGLLMLLVPCPWCGPRPEVEFRYGGQAGIEYPQDPDTVDDADWVEYVFMRDNPKGPFRERWVHSAGCRRWFVATRDTVTHEFLDDEARRGWVPHRPRDAIRFRFDDVEYEGYAGDTIASALLANDVHVVGHGIYSGRPRGVFSAGSEEPNAIVQVRWPNGTSEPSLRATVVEIADGLDAWSLAGRGRLEGEDRGRFDKRYVHVETLVVGGGAGGDGRPPRRSGTVGCSSSTKGQSSIRSEGVQVIRASDGPRDLRPRLRARRRAPAGPPDRRPAVAHPGGSDRARHRCHRTTDPVPRQRSARDHAGERGHCLPRAVWRVAGAPICPCHDK